MRSAPSPALELPRRKLLLGAGAASLVLASEASAACRIRGYRSRVSCAEGCTDPDMTLDCQYRGMFPGEDDIARGTVMGALLGGVIAYAIGRPDLILGAIVAGGIVGGVVAGRDNYVRYSVARAAGNMPRAYQDVLQDRRAGEYNIAHIAYEQVGEIQYQEIRMLKSHLDSLRERPTRSQMRAIEGAVEAIEARAVLLGSTQTNSDQSLQVYDSAETELARAANTRPARPNAQARAVVAERGNVQAPYWAAYQDIQSNVTYAAAASRAR